MLVKRISGSVAWNRRADESPLDARWNDTPHPPLPGHLLPQGEKELQGSDDRDQGSDQLPAGCTRPTKLGLASLGEGGVARRSRVTEGVGAEKWRGMTLAVFITAVTPSDSPSASHLPQEEGLE
jgi:hypothetical protein